MTFAHCNVSMNGRRLTQPTRMGAQCLGPGGSGQRLHLVGVDGALAVCLHRELLGAHDGAQAALEDGQGALLALASHQGGRNTCNHSQVEVRI
jgi:hypothetical protein